MGSTLRIRDTDDIRALAGGLSLWHSDRRSLEVALLQLDEAANQQLHRRIARHYLTCGCHQGRLGGVGILEVYLLLIASSVLFWSAFGRSSWPR